MILSFEDKTPAIDSSCFIAEDADIIGAVTIGRNSSVWFHTVIRADRGTVTIGEDSNVQDNSVVHMDSGRAVLIGDRVTIGHGAIVHGCVIGDDCLIGMGAIIMNGARIGKGCVVGAGALVTQNVDIPDGSLVLGSPAKIIRAVSEADRETFRRNALSYVEEAAIYKKEQEDSAAAPCPIPTVQ